jgi:hypothetical protein
MCELTARETLTAWRPPERSVSDLSYRGQIEQ